MDHKQRVQDAQQGVYLPELGVDTLTLTELRTRLIYHETRLASPTLIRDGYDIGTATVDDEIGVRLGQAGIVLTTEHATTHYRKDAKTGVRTKKAFESGTAAVAALLAEEFSATHITMLGRQTGDANHDPQHPFKRLVGQLLTSSEEKHTLISVHGLVSGQVAKLDDERGYDVIVGVGEEPSNETAQLGNRIVTTAQSMGLHAGINTPLLKIISRDNKHYVRVDDEGSFSPISFAASSPRTVRSTAEAISKRTGQTIGCVQIELAGTLRLLHVDAERNERVKLLGAYMGYHVLAKTLA
jgi:hypothetical protein